MSKIHGGKKIDIEIRDGTSWPPSATSDSRFLPSLTRNVTVFEYKKIFGSGHFLTFFQISWIEKMPGAKKVVNIKNQFLHARQLREGIFDIC